MQVKFLDLLGQYEALRPHLDDVWFSVHRDSSYVGGRLVDDFELAFAEYQGVPHAIGVGNGTDAIEIALAALDLPPGSEVIVPANSFVASSEAVTNAGMRVVFADVDESYTVDVEDVARRITPNTSAILAVHLYGLLADMPALCELSSAHGLRVIEDSAQAHGASLGGVRAGGFGDAATFSFYPGKNLGAYGDGGAIVTGDPTLALKARRLANHGRTSKYDHEFEGRNSRLDALQAGVLTVKLRHLDEWLARRRSVAAMYDSVLGDVEQLTLPMVREGAEHAYHLYVVRCARRDELRAFLAERGIATGVHYPTALPMLRAYRYLNQSDTPNAILWSGELLSLPIGEHLSRDEVHYVISTIRAFFELPSLQR